jgi:hypothetical protein
MKFTLSKSHLYWWPVTVRLPDPENPGQIVEQVLRVQFEPRSRDQQLEAQEAAAKLTNLRDIIAHDIAEARAVVRNWDDVIGEDGQLVPFTPENLELALQQPWFRKAVQVALAESMNGEEARRGN